MYILAGLIMLSWPAVEVYIALTRRARAAGDQTFEGGGAGRVWLVAAPCSLLAVALYFLPLLPMPFEPSWRVLAASLLVLGGALFRLSAIRTLGRMFTVDVSVREGHELVQRGPYRLVRHPSYTGLLASFAGVGLASGCWVGLAVATIPLFLVLGRRISVEERALTQGLGQSYREYSRRTKRLIPWVY